MARGDSRTYWNGKPMHEFNQDDVTAQAKWELAIELFEAAVAREKERLRNRRHWFPWRIRIINVNEVKR